LKYIEENDLKFLLVFVKSEVKVGTKLENLDPVELALFG